MYCIDPTADEPIMLISTHIGNDDEGGFGVSGSEFQRELMYLDGLGKKRIQVWINSSGGSVMEGYNIAATILKTKTPVDTYNLGLAGSIAGVIFMCGRNRVMMDYAQFMMHPVQGVSNKKVAEAFNESISSLLSAKSDISQEQVESLMKDTTWLNAEDCMKNGFCTAIENAKDVNKKRLSTASIDNFYKEVSLIVNKLVLTKTKKSMLKVTNKLGLNDDANEESILRAIQEVENKATSEKTQLMTDIDALKNQLTEKQNELNAVQAVADAAVIENCKNMVSGFSNRIGTEAAAVEKWVSLAKKDFEGTKAMLESLPINKAANRIEITGGNDEPKTGTYIFEKLTEISNRSK